MLRQCAVMQADRGLHKGGVVVGGSSDTVSAHINQRRRDHDGQPPHRRDDEVERRPSPRGVAARDRVSRASVSSVRMLSGRYSHRGDQMTVRSIPRSRSSRIVTACRRSPDQVGRSGRSSPTRVIRRLAR